jgi:hypothetical protein
MEKKTEKPEPAYLTFRRRDGSPSDVIPLERELNIVSVVKYEVEKDEKPKGKK